MASETLDNNGIDVNAIEQDVKKSSLGQWLLENTKLFIGVVVGITIAALAFVWIGKAKESSKVETYSEIYKFKKSHLEKLSDKETKIETVISAYEKLISQVSNKAALTPVALELSNEIIKKDKKLDKGVMIIEKTLNIAGAQAGSELLKVQLASLYEDQNKANKSAEVLESLKKKLPTYLSAYTYFHLGRLYKGLGNKTKAKEQLDYVVKTYKDSEEAKLATILLEEL